MGWIPIVMKQLYDRDMAVTDPIFVVLTAFYGLNLFWYYKIVRILIKGVSSAGDEKGDNGKEKEE